MNVALILNYKAATETISCVESLRSHCRAIDHIIVIDNDSQDGSLVAFQQWQQEAGAHNVTLLANPQNNGYAGGNNYGIRWAQANLPVEHYWIVNNDTYVEEDAFSPLLEELKRNDRQFVGSVILSAADGHLECYGGGKLYPLLGKAKLLGKGQTLESMAQQQEQPDYLMGCSLAFSARLLERIGLMDEDYFMYSEEVDWQFQARKLGVGIKVVPASRLFHYGSLSSGGRSAFYHYYRNRAATRFNKRFYGAPFALASACFLSAITLIKEYNHPALAWSGIKGAFKGVTMSVE
ncbi:glycosyltransferase family 2 protein [Pseudomonas oligotrophica]|uniref:glycosyltransferase family 2 protein n=1 Tax=Pseudomonas oligotrophica TaxID=2912055 RepID=UPI001F2F4924|nr:glycosyltransferase family 2 protein [Pseudomonas oligotrophica]MCF7204086.1 glycosyltransferase family 2 protein [Pseudomonas oligotrophica]